MRKLIDLLDSLNNSIPESRGLSGRKPGAIYKRGEDPDDQIVFQNLTFYPKVGQYATKEETQAAFDKVQQSLNHPIEMINQPSGTNRAFGIATFDTAVGTRYLVKFAQNIKPLHDQNKFFQTDDIPGGFSQADARGSKENVGYKPSQVLKKFKSQTPDSIMAQIEEKFGADSDEYRAAEIITSTSSFPISVQAGKMDFAGFRDYFCEMLQPILLIKGGPVEGNADEAADKFLDGTFSNCIVSFNENTTGGLYDSLLINPVGKQLKLSSKGGAGAMASSVNLMRSLQELESAGMTEFRKNYAETISVLEIIDRGTHDSGPLELAVKFEIIEPTEIPQIMSLKSLSGGENFDIDETDISENLKKIYKDRKAENPSKVVPLNHLVSSIAYKVCNEINMKTDFSDAAADILNHSAFVQMYTLATKRKDQFVINGFNTVWPSKLFTEVTLEAQKSYSSTSSSGGKLVFNINKTPKTIPNAESDKGDGFGAAAPAKTSTADLDAVTDRRSDIKAADTQAMGSDEALGRQRRRR